MLRWFSLCLVCVAFFASGCSNSYVEVKNYESVIEPQEVYAIRTRIVVEDINGVPARNTSDIIKDVWFSQKVFSGLNIKIVIVDMALALPNQSWNSYIAQDAAKYPNMLSIYYTYGRPKISGITNLSGVGALPWLDIPHGVFVYGPSKNNNVLAHEIGHYLGLLHTFHDDLDGNGDRVDDTLSETEFKDLYGDDAKYGSYNNLMNYHWHYGLDFLTRGQLDRAEGFLRTSRQSILITIPVFDNLKIDNDVFKGNKRIIIDESKDKADISEILHLCPDESCTGHFNLVED